MSNPNSNDLLSNSRVLDIAIQPDNKIVVVGFVQNDDNPYGFIACFKPDQTLDKTFGPEGTGIIKNYQIKFFDKIALQPDGKIIVGSYQEAYSEDPYGNLNARIVRYTHDGTFDLSFREGHGIMCGPDKLESITVQRDNKIVIVKLKIPTEVRARQTVIVRYKANTAPDREFGPNGICTLQPALTNARMVAFQPDGKMLIKINDGYSTNKYLYYPDFIKRYRNMTPEEIEGRRLATLAAQQEEETRLATLAAAQEAARLAAEEAEINALMGINFELCSIWLEDDATQNLIETECHHSFHPACMAQWRNSGQGVAANRCPLCRADLPNLP